MYGTCNRFDIPPPIPYVEHNISIEETTCSNVFDPSIWGEGTWLFLHLGSLAANEQLSPTEAEKYWGFIEGLPYMLPCKNCSVHAQKYVDISRPRRAQICSSREALLHFFVDFHNMVNSRTGKPPITVEQVKNMLRGQTRVCKVKYTL